MVWREFSCLFLLSICSHSYATVTGKKWALLVAGSSGYMNYRHQADICHSFQILKKNGISEKNIIVMMYDDIAHNENNPTPGQIINHPNGSDVYAGVPKDYTGNDVNPESFLNILLGNSDAMTGIGSGRVIKSRANDVVFVNFVDHGGPGVLLFPNDELTVGKFIKALNSMASDHKFSKMILYIEACFSGSMFDDVLDDNLNIFVMTAADPHESSYACYWDDTRNAYLGDVFSVNWMHEAENEPLSSVTLNHLFEKVRTNTSKSHVEEYGDIDIGNTFISHVITNGNQSQFNEVLEKSVLFEDPNEDSVPSTDVPLTTLLRKQSPSKITEIRSLFQKRNTVKEKMREITSKICHENKEKIAILEQSKYSIKKESLECYEQVIKTFSNNCFKIAKNPFVVNYLQIFVNACNVDWTNKKQIISVLKFKCANLEKMEGVV